MSYLTTIVEKAWDEAVRSPSIPRWRSLAQMAAHVSDSIAERDPNSIMVVAHRAIYQEAYARMLAMEPNRETV